MASKHRGSSRAGGTAGQSKLLHLLRRHGFAEELPPSTVSWLDTRPVFRWLAEHLSDDNFVDQDTQRLYDSIQLQAGPPAGGAGASGAGGGAQGQAQLLSVMGISSGSGSDSDDEGRRGEGGGWDEPRSVEELQQAIEEQQAHLGLLQEQLASVGAAARRISSAPAAAVRAAAQQRRAVLGSLRAARLRAAQAAAADAGGEVDAQLQRLADELEAWGQLADGAAAGGEGWLLTALDAAAYAARDAEMQELVSRGMQLVSAAAAMPPAAAAGSEARSDGGGSDGEDGCAPGGAGARKAAWGQGSAGDARRWRDQERRNEGLKEELTRQRVAFKVAYDARLEALVQQAGAEGALSALEALIDAEAHRRGGRAAGGAAPQLAAAAGGARGAAAGAAGEGADAIMQQVPQLRREAESLERERVVLQEVQLPALHVALARLNDTHVLEGDYERQLAKMRVAHARKRALIETLLDAAARHAVLRGAQARELEWLARLSAAAEGARAAAAAAAEAAARREVACGAAAAAAAAAQQRSSVAPDDLYLTRLQQAMRPSGANWQAVAAGGEGWQQGGGGGGGGGAAQGTPQGAGGLQMPSLTPRSARPAPQGFSSIKDLCTSLTALADALRAGGGALEAGLFEGLPQRLGEILAAERQLRGLAFPQQDAYGGGAAAGGGAGEAAAGAAAGGGGGGGAPLLTSPALSDAMRSLEALNHSIGGAINKLLQQQQDWAAVQRQHAREQALQRRVMALMFSDPPQLAAAVGELRGRVQALAAAARGGGGGGGGGGAGQGAGEAAGA